MGDERRVNGDGERSKPGYALISRPSSPRLSSLSFFSLTQIYGEIRRRRPRRHLVEKVGDEAAVVGRVVDDVQEYLAPRHDARITADQREAHAFVERGVRQLVAPGDVPLVDHLLCAPQFGKRRVPRGVARGIAVVASLEMSLPDQVDDIVM